MQENRFAVFKFKVTVRAHMIKYDCLLSCWSFLHPDLVGWHSIISWRVGLCVCVSKLDCCFKVKISVKDQNFIESLCILYLLYYWSLCNDSHCTYLLLLITKPSTTKWVYTDSRALTYSIIRHTIRGYSSAQGDKPCLSCVWWFLVLLFFWHENATMSFLLLLGSIAACWAEQQPHTCFCFKSKSEWSASQVVLHKMVFW